MAKYAEINPVDPNERKALFDLMCKDICMMGRSEVLKKILGIEGGSASLKEYEPDMNDICRVLEIYDVQCDLKITYSELKTSSDKKHMDHITNAEERLVSEAKSMKVCEEYKDMKKQKEDIKIDDVKVEAINIVKPEKKDESFNLNVTEIPDGPDFLT